MACFGSEEQDGLGSMVEIVDDPEGVLTVHVRTCPDMPVRVPDQAAKHTRS
jgi:hypothetical protein